MISFPPGWSDYACNTQGPMYTHQLIEMQSHEDGDLFIELFENALRSGYNIEDDSVQDEIFSRGQLGGYDLLVPFDQKRVTNAVRKMLASGKY